VRRIFRERLDRESSGRVARVAPVRLERTLVCVDPDGRTLRLRSQRIASLADRHVGAIRLEIAIEDGPSAHVAVVSAVRTHEGHGPLPHVELVATGSVGEIAVLHSRTPGNRVAVDHAIAVTGSARGSALAGEHIADEDMCGRAVACDLSAGEGASITARLDAASDAAEGESIELWIDTSKIHLFDAETGDNIQRPGDDAEPPSHGPSHDDADGEADRPTASGEGNGHEPATTPAPDPEPHTVPSS